MIKTKNQNEELKPIVCELNSILLEGEVVSKPISFMNGKTSICQFMLLNKRKFKNSLGMTIEENQITIAIETAGDAVKYVMKHGEIGRKVRVVGMLARPIQHEKNIPLSSVCIRSEHVEFREGIKTHSI
jgi:hypothetical protein